MISCSENTVWKCMVLGITFYYIQLHFLLVGLHKCNIGFLCCRKVRTWPQECFLRKITPSRLRRPLDLVCNPSAGEYQSTSIGFNHK